MTTSLDANLLVDYDELLRNATLRELYRRLPVDNATETLNLADPMASLREGICNLADSHLAGGYQDVRLSVKQFITKYFFDPGVTQRITNRVLYERLTGLSKLMVVGMVMERENLRGMGGTPTLDDLPQAYAQMAAFLARARKHWDEIQCRYRQEHLEMCTEGKSFAMHFTGEQS